MNPAERTGYAAQFEAHEIDAYLRPINRDAVLARRAEQISRKIITARLADGDRQGRNRNSGLNLVQAFHRGPGRAWWNERTLPQCWPEAAEQNGREQSERFDLAMPTFHKVPSDLNNITAPFTAQP